jgi:hypothetical protein
MGPFGFFVRQEAHAMGVSKAMEKANWFSPMQR